MGTVLPAELQQQSTDYHEPCDWEVILTQMNRRQILLHNDINNNNKEIMCLCFPFSFAQALILSLSLSLSTSLVKYINFWKVSTA